MYTFLFFAFLIFAGALMGAAYYLWQVPAGKESKMLSARLREIRVRGGARRTASTAHDLMIQESGGKSSTAGRFLLWLGPTRRLQDFIDQANLRYRAVDVLTVALVTAVVVHILTGLFGSGFLALRLALALAFGYLPIFYIQRVRAQRLEKFESALPDAIDLFNRSMRAGHNIQAGLESIANETLDPIKMEFKRVVEELALGSVLEAALHNLGRRVPLIDLKFFITGLILQRQTGANMVTVLENLSSLIRERLNLAAKMRSATTQQRFSAGLLCALPFVMGLGFWILKPEYIRLLFQDPTGQQFLTYALVSEAVGILVIRQLSTPKF